MINLFFLYRTHVKYRNMKRNIILACFMCLILCVLGCQSEVSTKDTAVYVPLAPDYSNPIMWHIVQNECGWVPVLAVRQVWWTIQDVWYIA